MKRILLDIAKCPGGREQKSLLLGENYCITFSLSCMCDCMCVRKFSGHVNVPKLYQA
jgi:hypothetical protein